MQSTINNLNEQLGKTNFGLIIFRGRLVPLGSMPASEFRYSKNGTPYWKGNVSYESTVEGRNGKTYTKKKIRNFTAFGNLATQLGTLQEGNEVCIIAEDTSQKGQDGKYYDNAIVLAFDLLG